MSVIPPRELTRKPKGLVPTTPPVPPAPDADVLTYDTAQQAAGGAPLTASRITLMSALVAGLKSDGVWTGFDRLTLLAGPNDFASRYDLKNPVKFCTVVGTVIFTADLGYTGDGTTGYLDTGEPVVGGTNQALAANISAGVWCNQQNGALTIKPHIGTTETTYKLHISAIANGGADLYRANDITDSGLQVASSTRLGHRALTRTSTSSKRAFYNGVNTAATTTTGSTPSLLNLLILKNNTASFGPDRIAAYWVGRAMTDAEQTMIYNRLFTYLSAIGAN